MKEVPWTKSTGLWTEGHHAGPWSIVDQSPYRFARSNQGHQILIRWPRANEQGQAQPKAARPGRAVVESLERCRNGPLVAGCSP
jgi:hypothetical protein